MKKDLCGMLVLFNSENTTEGMLFRAEQFEDKNLWRSLAFKLQIMLDA